MQTHPRAATVAGKSESNEPALDIGVDTNLAEQMRSALILLTTRCAHLKPLPDKCSFIIATELKDDVDLEPPVGHPQAWISVQPSLPKTGEALRQDPGALRFTPIRTVEAGTFKFETWIEERTGEVRCS